MTFIETVEANSSSASEGLIVHVSILMSESSALFHGVLDQFSAFNIQTRFVSIAALVFTAFLISAWYFRRKPCSDGKQETLVTRTRARGSFKQAVQAIRGSLMAVGCFSLVINLLMLVTPLYMLQLYDRVLTSRSYDTLIYLTVLAGILLSLSAVLELVRSRILVRVGGIFDNKLDDAVFTGLFKDNRHAKHDTISEPLRDMSTIRGFLTGPGPAAFFDSPWTPLFIGLIFLFHPLLGVIAAFGAFLLFCIALISELVTRSTFGKASFHNSKAQIFADAALRNTEVVRGMGMTPQLLGRWRKLHDEGMAYHSEANDRVGLLSALSKLIRPALQIAMLGSGAFLVLQEQISPGVMIAASIIMGRALAPVEAAVSQWRSFVGTRAAVTRMKTFLAETEVENDKMELPAPKGNLLLENVTVTPPSGRAPVLKDITMGLEAGTILGVIGPSAAGKSSLARILVGVWQASDGCVRIDGADINQWDPEKLGPHIGYLPQDVELFDGTVAENIARFAEVDPKSVIQAAKLAGAHEMILQLSNGYDTYIGPGGSVLSGGQRQRIGMARALFKLPALIVLDEPNASLDSEGEKALLKSLRKLGELKCTVIVISHRSSILTAVDKVLLLRDGTMDSFGTRETVLPKLVGTAHTTPNTSHKQALEPGRKMTPRALRKSPNVVTPE